VIDVVCVVSKEVVAVVVVAAFVAAAATDSEYEKDNSLVDDRKAKWTQQSHCDLPKGHLRCCHCSCCSCVAWTMVWMMALVAVACGGVALVQIVKAPLNSVCQEFATAPSKIWIVGAVKVIDVVLAVVPTSFFNGNEGFKK
jgi:hypothetical protein